eukprot:CAMPEP_0181297030 /NCGR_PEP_ID=MMETSP1101-20121128/5017_1 /TAXON_ID=46948 /ORGANISM="Rhodomonas abbreviata, Strain Caron Lab Isolate" /LENGTH=150 /DNA_ID=CAMNT_0023401929 /DNA_START=29 /DNA_END=478 /DNA_ORIENTATION=+
MPPATGSADFVSAVNGAILRFKEQGTGDAQFQLCFNFEDDRTEELQDKLALGGDPTFSVSSIPRTHNNPVDALGFASVALADDGMGEIDPSMLRLNSPPSEIPSWGTFGALMGYFAMKEDLCDGMEDPATYAAFVGIAEPPLAVLLRTAW